MSQAIADAGLDIDPTDYPNTLKGLKALKAAVETILDEAPAEDPEEEVAPPKGKSATDRLRDAARRSGAGKQSRPSDED